MNSKLNISALILTLVIALPTLITGCGKSSNCGCHSVAKHDVTFEKTVVDTTFRAEGAAVADVDNDGDIDIITGEMWYEAPDWIIHEIKPIGTYDGTTGYSNNFATFAQDVNKDGWMDAIIIGFPSQPCTWYENPKNNPGHWKERVISPSACNETPQFGDINGDGEPELVFGVGPEGEMAWFSKPDDLNAETWVKNVIDKGPKAPGSDTFSHGLGIGDINSDGRNDVLTISGWWLCPEDPTTSPWQFQQVGIGESCSDLLVYDVDGDGDSDIITSSAHGYGIWWMEQVNGSNGSEFIQHEIYKSFSQTHAMRLADINNDGLTDFITGKRYFSHNGHDEGAFEPAVMYWFELTRKDGQASFIPHQFDDNSGVGTQFTVADFNNDGMTDVITSNKKGRLQKQGTDILVAC